MSVHAHGGEPGSHPDVAILRWNTTDNALELNLSEFSGLVACIDELGAYNDENSHHCCITSPLAAQKFAWINQSEEESLCYGK
jgi:hypothetical protein